jgi:hypothetical protein
MAPKQQTETTTAARIRLQEEMIRLDERIDRQPSGSAERLELLRRQASLGDLRESLISDRR